MNLSYTLVLFYETLPSYSHSDFLDGTFTFSPLSAGVL